VDERAAQKLRAKLNEGLARSGLTATRAATRSRLGRTTVSQALNSSGEIPTARTVAALARVLQLDEQRLLDLRKAAAGDEAGSADGPGRLISQCDPLDLEVHPAGAVRDAARVLPGYVRRRHDEELAAVVDAAVGGRSGMAVLVGSSSTGKTRACWEAVQPLAAAGWRLWHPYDPTRVEAALHGLGQVTSCTVVWLNEARHYLNAGEKMAAALHSLPTDAGRAPVLVLVTLWPDYAKACADQPLPGQPDPYARTRELLSGRRIEAVAEFDEAGLRGAERLAGAGDRLWAAVLTHDHHRRLARHLAGAPELMRRYGEVSPVAKALLHSAMDAYRLGAGPICRWRS
jgi:transcriptional regulator with XRE-family HTH domain